MPVHATEVLAEAFRRAVLALFVERELFEPEVEEGMLGWLHSGFRSVRSCYNHGHVP